MNAKDFSLSYVMAQIKSKHLKYLFKLGLTLLNVLSFFS